MEDDPLRDYVDWHLKGVPQVFRDQVHDYLSGLRDALAEKGMDPRAVTTDIIRKFEKHGTGPLLEMDDKDFRSSLAELAEKLRAPAEEEETDPSVGPLKALAGMVSKMKFEAIAAIGVAAAGIGLEGDENVEALMDELSQEEPEEEAPGEPPEEPPAGEPSPPPALEDMLVAIQAEIDASKLKALQLGEELGVDTTELTNLFDEMEGAEMLEAPEVPEAPSAPEIPEPPAAEAPAAPEAAEPGAPEAPEAPSIPEKPFENEIGALKNQISQLADELGVDPDVFGDLFAEL